MSGATDFVTTLRDNGVGLVAGVPCSYLAGPISVLEHHPGVRYVAAANEGAALAIAAGARLAGAQAAVFTQSSGFGNLINPLTSLVLPYQIPILVVMSMRGLAADGDDAPQHQLTARTAQQWLTSLSIPHRSVTATDDAVTAAGEAMGLVRSGTTTFLLLAKDAIGGERPLPRRQAAVRTGMTRTEFIEVVTQTAKDAFVLSTTGYMSRSLYAVADSPRNFYMQGSMGHVASLALGAALSRPDRSFLVLDGDGALIMHLGALIAMGAQAPPNLVHIVFDNQAYESTGSQPVPRGHWRYEDMARACGYTFAAHADAAEKLRKLLRAAQANEGPSFISVDAAAEDAGGGAAAAPRASGSLPLPQIAARFSESVGALCASRGSNGD
jgi:phosphonopyruvate decarboxylase